MQNYEVAEHEKAPVEASGNNARKRKQPDIDDQKKEDEPEPEASKQLKLSNLNFKAIKPLDRPELGGELVA